MKLVVGLGNPGLKYKNTRHNIGFLTIDALAQELKLAFKKNLFAQGWVAKGSFLGEQIILVKPNTFMNLSGRAVGSLIKKYKIKPKGLLVICDDLNLDTGQIRIKTQGSHAGHQGLHSIINALGTKEFSRLKIGIGRPADSEDFAEFVLSEFKTQEKKEISLAIKKAVSAVLVWLEHDMDRAMNKFN